MSNEKSTAGETAMKVYTFNESNQPIRVDVVNGDLWFVAKDVARALGIGWRGDTLASIPEEWRGMRRFRTPGGEQDLVVISEAGMYKLAFRCQSSEVADKFTNWVASEVLPQIRKTGRYEVGGGKAAKGRPKRSRNEKVNAELMNLLWLIGESLQQGEVTQVALELGVSRVTVSNVLNGYSRNAKVLMALYQRAKANRACGMLYFEPKVMAERLVSSGEGDVVVSLPVVNYHAGKRGGRIGNQNARKHWGKESK